MKKNLFFILSFATILLAGCMNSNQLKEIDSNTRESDEGLSVSQVFDSQIEDAQYLKDLEKYVSYDILSSTENNPFTSDFSLSVKFDSESSVLGGLDFSESKISKSYNQESRDIEFNVIANDVQNNSDPFEASGSVTLLYQNNEMYANLHKLGIFMGEGNMVAKMYSLLGEMIIDNRVNLEINNGGIISINSQEDVKLKYITGTIQNVLKTPEIYDSPDFLNSVTELIDTVNSHIDLGISTNGLSIASVEETKYAEIADGIIQKEFTASFQGDETSFDLNFIASKKGLRVHLYNIAQIDPDSGEFINTESEFLFSINENKKSEYNITFQSIKSQQNIVDIEGSIDFGDTVKFKGNFVLEPMELTTGQHISGKLNGNIIKQPAKGDEILPELSGDIVMLSDLMSSL